MFFRFINEPAQGCPPSLTSFANFVLLFPLFWAAETFSTIAIPQSKLLKSAVVGNVSKSKGNEDSCSVGQVLAL